MKKRMISSILVLGLSLFMTSSCSGSADEVIGSDAQEESASPVVIDITLTDEEYGIGVNKNKPELLEGINKYIEEGLHNGKYEEITGHYFGGEGEPVGVPANEIKSGVDQLVVATTADFEPFDMEEGDIHYGIDKEIMKYLADSLGKELVFVNVNFDLLFATVSQGKCDACIAGITINDDRKEYVDFSVPYFEAGLCLVAGSEENDFSGAKTREEIEDILSTLDESTVIAVESKTTGEDYLEGTGDTAFEGVSCKILRCSTLSECINALKNGSCDYVIGDNATLKYMLADK
ncbi:transporter substrate-binding domain-containing protein [Butyrivibrio sp. JL13D10]|uniref:transporter substrate-binding domain-containing protein n=1 Tax=Butyrivibrio sp. JL13D10 TaxID=3236815 RepID=UPI0038B586F8